jgi:outer membrane protein assembly factor BamD
MRNILVLVALFLLSACSKSISKVMKNPDPEYKLRMAEKYFVQEKYSKAQMLYEDIMPYYKRDRSSRISITNMPIAPITSLII